MQGYSPTPSPRARAAAHPCDEACLAATSDTGLWACDGCPVTGTEAQVLAHLDAVLLDTDGRPIDPPDAPCRGAYEVGGPAWEAHVFHGVHPMAILDADLRALAAGGAL